MVVEQAKNREIVASSEDFNPNSLITDLIISLTESGEFLEASDPRPPRQGRDNNYWQYQKGTNQFGIFYRANVESEEIKIDRQNLEADPRTIQRYLVITGCTPSITFIGDARDTYSEQTTTVNTQEAEQAFRDLIKLL